MNPSSDVPSRFKPGDLVWANYRPKRHGKCTIWLAVVCPNFGSKDDKYTKLEERVYMGGFTRYYHVQSIGSSFEEAWLPQFELNMIKHENMKELMATAHARILDDPATFKYCQMFVEKTNEEILEICRIRAETFHSFHNFAYGKLNEVTETEIREMKIENMDLKNQLRSLKESCSKFEKFLMSQTQDKPQNLDQFQSKQETQSNGENSDEGDSEDSQEFEQPTKKIKVVWNDRHNKRIRILRETVMELKKDNSKLSNEIAKLSKENEDYKEERRQTEALIKNLKGDLLKLSK